MFPPWNMVAFGILVSSKRHQWQPLTKSPAGHRKSTAGLALNRGGNKTKNKAGINFDKTAGLSQLVLPCWWANPASPFRPSSHSIVHPTQDQVEPCLLGRVAAEILFCFSPFPGAEPKNLVATRSIFWMNHGYSIADLEPDAVSRTSIKQLELIR